MNSQNPKSSGRRCGRASTHAGPRTALAQHYEHDSGGHSKRNGAPEQQDGSDLATTFYAASRAALGEARQQEDREREGEGDAEAGAAPGGASLAATGLRGSEWWEAIPIPSR